MHKTGKALVRFGVVVANRSHISLMSSKTRSLPYSVDLAPVGSNTHDLSMWHGS